MLPKFHRIPAFEIPLVMRSGKRIIGNGIQIIFKNTDSPGNKHAVSRFCFIVPATIDKRATRRNRMRRTMSESVQHLFDKIGSIDGIFIAKKNFADLPQTDVEKIIEDLLLRARVLRG